MAKPQENRNPESGSVRERPILFSAPMVRAILDGRKTQTRRILKLDPFTMDALDRLGIGDLKLGIGGYGGMSYYDANGGCTSFPLRCPYGASGDRLWCREGIRLIERREPKVGLDRDTAVYAADGELTPLDTWCWQRTALPAIHMPRGLCRIELEVAAVRVERLHDITEEDARAEGVVLGEPIDVIANGERSKAVYFDARTAFAHLWCDINGADSWQANPYVWVVSFRRVEAA